MKLIVITPETFVKGEAEIINKLFWVGLEYLHIRKPTANEETVRSFIKCIDSSFRKRLIIHKHVHLFEEMALGGIHVGVEEFSALAQKTLQGVCSISTHSIAEFKAFDSPTTHIFISPVFNSISKIGYYANPDLLAAGSISRNGRLIALGGICCENILEVKRYGFDGAAILGYLWNSDTPLNQFNKIQKMLHHAHEI